MKQDRFLVGILAFIGLLAVTAVALYFFRREAPAYGPEDTPQGVVRNYAIALQGGDYQRAYGYLADEPAKPSAGIFRRAFLDRRLENSNAALQVGQSVVNGSDATVEVLLIYDNSGPFGQGAGMAESALLVMEGGAWRIRSMPYPYWDWGWYQPAPASAKP